MCHWNRINSIWELEGEVQGRERVYQPNGIQKSHTVFSQRTWIQRGSKMNMHEWIGKVHPVRNGAIILHSSLSLPAVSISLNSAISTTLISLVTPLPFFCHIISWGPCCHQPGGWDGLGHRVIINNPQISVAYTRNVSYHVASWGALLTIVIQAHRLREAVIFDKMNCVLDLKVSIQKWHMTPQLTFH